MTAPATDPACVHVPAPQGCPDLQVLQALATWRRAGQHALLATVVRTWGSSPRPVGAILALREDGAVAGSVSGGCIEDDLVLRYAAPGALVPRPPEVVRYGLTADEAHRFGLPCGGTLELVLEFDPCPAALESLVQALQARRTVCRSVSMADGRAQLAPARPGDAPAWDGSTLRNVFGPSHRLLLIGAGQLSECLAGMALACGFAVTVCDPRAEYASRWAVAGATVMPGMPDDVVAAFGMDARTGVVALTHDPKLDDLALLEAIGSPAFYVGAIGSARTAAARRGRLREHFGLSDASLARLHAPVGLAIGSRTPPEIAVSILAEVLAAKNGAALPPLARMAQRRAQKADPQPRRPAAGGVAAESAPACRPAAAPV